MGHNKSRLKGPILPSEMSSVQNGKSYSVFLGIRQQPPTCNILVWQWEFTYSSDLSLKIWLFDYYCEWYWNHFNIKFHHANAEYFCYILFEDGLHKKTLLLISFNF
jgi:hypothetical protein